MEALSPRSTNLPMKAPAAFKKTNIDTRTKPASSVINLDKIDEKWRPAAVIKEPEPEGDAYLTGRKLGRGGFAVCFEGRSERTREIFALKVVKSHVEQKKQLEKVVLSLMSKDALLTASSSEQSYRSMRRCTTRALLSSIAPSLSKIIPMLSSNYAPTVHSWIWSKPGNLSVYPKFVGT